MILLLGGCLDQVLESPYVLTPGLGEGLDGRFGHVGRARVDGAFVG